MANTDAARMMALFAGFAGAHGTHGVPRRAPDSLKWEIKSTARTLREPVTEALWQGHLDGKKPLGVITIREDGLCKWGSIDYDVYDTNLLELVERAEKLEIPLVPCRSKSGGLHLFVFLKEWTAADLLLAALRSIAARLGISGSEIFPRQTQVLVERGDLGNWMVMPYYGSTFDGKLQNQFGLKKSGAEMSIKEFLNTAERSLVDEETLVEAARSQGSVARPRVTGKKSKDGAERDHPVAGGSGPFSDGPCCLQHLAADGVAKGHQNNALLMMGIYFKKVDPVGWKQQLEDAARDFLTPPGTSEGTASVIKSLEKKDYEYTCKIEPMVGHCNSAVCRTRKFGIGSGEYPVIAGMRKLEAEPTVWFIDLEDGATVELNTNELSTYALFVKKCMDVVTKTFLPMKQTDWQCQVSEAMKNCTPLDPEEPMPEEVSEKTRIVELLEEFCTNRKSTSKAEDLFNGSVWFDEEAELYWFRLRDAQSFIMREGVRDVTRGQIVLHIRRLGGGHKTLNIKGRYPRAWFLSSSAVKAPPDPTPRRMPQEGI